MYLGIDVGGTKTLVASLDDDGVIVEKQKFPTSQDYGQFLNDFTTTLNSFNNKDFRAVGVGIPATSIDRYAGIARAFGNLAWKNVPVQADIEKIVASPVAVENDAKLAGLSESMLKPDFRRLLYVTISTGVGYSLIVDHMIDPNIGDGGGTLIMLEHNGEMVSWESFASGKAIVATFGRMAKDITDAPTLDTIARNISVGLIELLAVTEPEIVVIGGSVGRYAERFIDPLNQYMKGMETPLFPMPKIVPAVRPDDAVIYGCYDYAKQIFGNS